MSTQEQAKFKQQITDFCQELSDEQLSLFLQILSTPKELDRLIEALDKGNPKPSVPDVPKGINS